MVVDTISKTSGLAVNSNSSGLNPSFYFSARAESSTGKHFLYFLSRRRFG
jgi:hypothetical protein